MQTYDYIIVGGGSAGCVLANRLTADPGVQVLLLEAGPADTSPLIHMPKGFGKLLGDTTHVRQFETEPPAGFGVDMWPKGMTLGGSSSVNGTLYVRGQPEDYDDWAASGAAGWSWEDVAPAFKALEDHALGGSETRGIGGPLHVSPVQEPHSLSLATIEAAASLGVPKKTDINSLPQEGVGLSMGNIKDGVRVSAATAFLKPIRSRRNLCIHTGAFVNRVLFDGTLAVGVDVRLGGKNVRFTAAREVLLCAGTIQSPQLLQLSGVGPRDVLQKAGVNLVHPLEGVGHNLREHWMGFVQHELLQPISYNHQFAGIRLLRNAMHYMLFKRGLLAGCTHEVCGFVNASGIGERADTQFMMAPMSMKRVPGEFQFEKGHGMQLTAYPLRPQSQGSVMIASADPIAPPVIRPNYLAAELDRRQTIAALRFIRRIFAAPALAVHVGPETHPGPAVQSDEEIIDSVKTTGQSVFHCAGTCRMGADEGAVVDERLRVRGVKGLRVVDCSVMPSLVSGNTNAAVMMIAWRAADMILSERRE